MRSSFSTNGDCQFLFWVYTLGSDLFLFLCCISRMRLDDIHFYRYLFLYFEVIVMYVSQHWVMCFFGIFVIGVVTRAVFAF